MAVAQDHGAMTFCARWSLRIFMGSLRIFIRELAHLYGELAHFMGSLRIFMGSLRIFMGSLRIFMAGLAGGFQEKQAVACVVETGRRNEAMRRFVCCKLFHDGCLACAWVDENGLCGIF